MFPGANGSAGAAGWPPPGAAQAFCACFLHPGAGDMAGHPPAQLFQEMFLRPPPFGQPVPSLARPQGAAGGWGVPPPLTGGERGGWGAAHPAAAAGEIPPHIQAALNAQIAALSQRRGHAAPAAAAFPSSPAPMPATPEMPSSPGARGGAGGSRQRAGVMRMDSDRAGFPPPEEPADDSSPLTQSEDEGGEGEGEGEGEGRTLPPTSSRVRIRVNDSCYEGREGVEGGGAAPMGSGEGPVGAGAVAVGERPERGAQTLPEVTRALVQTDTQPRPRPKARPLVPYLQGPRPLAPPAPAAPRAPAVAAPAAPVWIALEPSGSPRSIAFGSGVSVVGGGAWDLAFGGGEGASAEDMAFGVGGARALPERGGAGAGYKVEWLPGDERFEEDGDEEEEEEGEAVVAAVKNGEQGICERPPRGSPPRASTRNDASAAAVEAAAEAADGGARHWAGVMRMDSDRAGLPPPEEPADDSSPLMQSQDEGGEREGEGEDVSAPSPPPAPAAGAPRESALWPAGGDGGDELAADLAALELLAREEGEEARARKAALAPAPPTAMVRFAAGVLRDLSHACRARWEAAEGAGTPPASLGVEAGILFGRAEGGDVHVERAELLPWAAPGGKAWPEDAAAAAAAALGSLAAEGAVGWFLANGGYGPFVPRAALEAYAASAARGAGGGGGSLPVPPVALFVSVDAVKTCVGGAHPCAECFDLRSEAALGWCEEE